MELKFSGIDNMNTQNPYEEFNENDYGLDSNSEKYWEQAKSEKEHQTKKKKVSFNDILTNMNLVVNKKGVLQFIQPRQPIKESQPINDYQYDTQYEEKYVPQQKQNAEQRVPLAQSVKQSYIYNKYFKDYADATAPPPEKKVPKTIEEYNTMVMEERIKRVEEKKRIAEIKSTKLMFTTSPDNNFTQINPRNIQTSRNSLRKMSFW
jgi:hypothetical protein